MTSKNNDDIKALVLTAVKLSARKAFFDKNEYISKRLVSGQYHLYSQLACVSVTDIREHIDGRIKNKTITNKLALLVKEGNLLCKKAGRLNLYWLANTDYLTNS